MKQLASPLCIYLHYEPCISHIPSNAQDKAKKKKKNESRKEIRIRAPLIKQ